MNLKEALESPEFGRVLEAKLDEVIETKGLISEEEADKRVQEAVAKQVGVRDLLTIARDRITSAKGIGDAAKEDLLLRFGVRDLGNGVLEAAAELDVKPELEGDTVKKTSAQVLEAKLEGAIKRERDKVQGSPGAQTRVGGQGPQGGGASDNGGDGDDGRVQEAKTEADVPDWVMAAHRAGVDVSEAYGWKLPESMTKAKA